MKLRSVLPITDPLVPVEIVAESLGLSIAQVRHAETRGLAKLRTLLELHDLRLDDLLPAEGGDSIWAKIERESS